MFFFLGANQVGIVGFLISLTDIFVAPYEGVFASPSAGGSFFDVAALLGIIIYTVLGFILSMLAGLFSEKTE